MGKDKSKNAKRWRRVRKIILISLSVILILIIALLSVAAIMLKQLHSISYEHNKPVKSDSTYQVDIENPPNIVTDGIFTPITDEPEPDEPSIETEGADTQEQDPPETATPYVPSNPSGSASSGSSGGQVSYPMPDNYVGKIPIYKVEQKQKNIQNFILVGRDVGSYYGRADSAMVVSYNTKTGDASIVSLLRDCYVPIEGHEWNKLGHALSYGGMGLYINTVNYVFDLDIQQYAVIDFSGVSEIVDEMGGIDVELTQAEVNYYNNNLGWKAHVGTNHLNGTQALRHCRNRSLAGTDFERARRQRDVLTAMYSRIMSMNYNDAMELVKKALTFVRTNVPFSNCISLASSILKNGLNSIKSTQAPFDGTWEYAYVRPSGYTGNIAVTKIDISANRRRINEYIYG